MTNCTAKQIEFSPLRRKKVTASFTGGDITSDAGGLLLREVDKVIGLSKTLAELIPDNRNQSYCNHSVLTMLRQRIYGMAMGYEDVNDHDYLRKDIALQTYVEAEQALAGKSTLSRFENSIGRKTIVEMNKQLVEIFIKSFKKSPKEIILDFDATDDKIYGNQEFRHYHGYYREHCYLPLYVFCKEHLLASFLRPANVDGAKHSWAVLSLLVKRLRREWPEVKIIFRADCGFCRHKIFNWCEKHNVNYIVGLPSNNVLNSMSAEIQQQVTDQFAINQQKQREFTELHYGASTWKNKRRVLVKAEYNTLGANTRYVVTNLTGDATDLYDDMYCARGDMENRIKEQQLDLFADRTSCHKWWANQFRLMLSGFAYTLLMALKNSALKATEFAKAQCSTIRLKLLKIGAVVIRNTRRIKFLASSAYSHQDLFVKITQKLCPE